MTTHWHKPLVDPVAIKFATYDDTFVNINGETSMLTLKNYRLNKPTLKVHIPSLIYIYAAPSLVTRFSVKPQGLSLSGILWAQDWSRGGAIIGPRSGYERSFLMLAHGHKLQRGFSIEDPEKFFAVLERVRPGWGAVAAGRGRDQAETGREASVSDGGREGGART